MTSRYLISLICFNLFCPLLFVFCDNFDNNSVEKKIKELKKELGEEQLESEHEEIDAQGYMIADWKRYNEKIQNIKENEEKRKKILDEIRLLEEQNAK